MANILNGFLSSMVGTGGNLRDYRHAEQLYGGNSMPYFPKFGWMYYVVFNIDRSISVEGSDFSGWCTKHGSVVGALSKKIIMPKFSVQTEVLNQYNKKTVVQKQITYTPVTITLHDDVSNATHQMWQYYYLYYFGDGKGGGSEVNPKYHVTPYETSKSFNYGLNNGQWNSFFRSIDIYHLHSKKYTLVKLINPIVKDWAHDQLDQTQGSTVLANQLTVEYESVNYEQGDISSSKPGFMSGYYDNTPGPLSIAGGGSSSLLGPGGLIPGAMDVYGSLSSFGKTGNPMDLFSAAIKGANVLKNAKGITSSGLKKEGMGILTGTATSLIPSVTAAIGAAFKKKDPASGEQTVAKEKTDV